jgi:hypothetical protein
MDFIESKKTKGIKSHINNLVSLALSDGVFSLAEKRLIFNIGRRHGLKDEKLKKIIKTKDPIKFKVPDNDNDRVNMVMDMVEMLLADGVVGETEIADCISIAEKMGFRKAIVGVLVRKVIMDYKEGKAKEDIKAECGNFLYI